MVKIAKKEAATWSAQFLILLFVLIIIFTPQASAATVGHGAAVISTGQFESGNYRFLGKRGVAC